MTYKVGIVGASGYGGAELVRLAAGHPDLDPAVLAAHQHAGRRVDEVLPNLGWSRRFAPADSSELEGLDVVFLATPHGPAAELAPTLMERGTRVVDLSPAFRLPEAEWRAAYGEAPAQPGLLPGTYGLSEWARTAVPTASLVANPGCYPTAALLALLPLAPLLDPASVVVDAKSGTSGAGRTPGDTLHHPHVDGGTTAYGLPRHRHAGEMEHHLATLGEDPGTAPFRILFTPHLMPMARGLLATCYATLREGVAPNRAEEALTEAYAHEPFVRVLPQGELPRTKAVAGSNACHLSLVREPGDGRRVIVLSAIDNLGKGAAGQALQNANLTLGLPEELGLSTMGVDP